ncbi:MAG: dolichol kinase [Halococcoides sp.]
MAIGDLLGERAVARRAVHATGSAIPIGALVVPGATWPRIQALLVVLVLIAIALEAIRLFVGLEWRIFELLTRSYEADNLAGYALFAIGMVLTGLLFGPSVAIPAMLMLTLGDPISGLLNDADGPGRKPWPVMAAMFAVCTAFALAFVEPIAAVAGGLVATAADGLNPRIRGYVIDDNLTIAPGAATAMALVGAVV